MFGVLVCGCSAYPVLDGVPVLRRGHVDVQDHMTGRAEVAGPDVAALVGLLRADRGVDALVEMLAFPPPVPFGLADKAGLRLPFTRGLWPRMALEARRGEVTAMLTEIDALTAQDWMELCYQRSSERISAELFPYFYIRYGQPRYLSSLSFLRALPQALPHDDRPVLDLACGFGHLMYHLGVRENPVTSVGLDRNFFQLWVGRRYIAPRQTFVCADRLDDLPFADDTFSAAVCTDAFHLFDVQQQCMDELRRVAAGDTVLLDRVGNANLEPTDSEHERDPQGYVDLVRGAPFRLVSEDELVAGYRAGHGPRLATPRDPAEFSENKWLSLITTIDTTLFRDDGEFTTPPHGAGELRINPIYTVERDGDDIHLVFSYPSTWYAFENSLMITFTSAGEHLDVGTFDALAAGHPTPQTPYYLQRFVALGMPPRYARRPGTPPRHPSVGAGLARGVRQRLHAFARPHDT